MTIEQWLAQDDNRIILYRKSGVTGKVVVYLTLRTYDGAACPLATGYGQTKAEAIADALRDWQRDYPTETAETVFRAWEGAAIGRSFVCYSDAWVMTERRGAVSLQLTFDVPSNSDTSYAQVCVRVWEATIKPT